MTLLSRVSVALTLASTTLSFAHPPNEHGQHDDVDAGHRHTVDASKVRAWTSAKTGEVVRGAFLSARTVSGAVMVSIERENGDRVVFGFDDLTQADRAEAQRRIDEVTAINDRVVGESAQQPAKNAATPKSSAPVQAAPFNSFAPFVSVRWDDRWLYVESDGLPHLPGGKSGTYAFSHPLMVGITAWQQQVPLPQNYRGNNAWQIPLKPEIAEKPVSANEQLFRGAIALAANGVPIFNPIKNDGRTDTFLAGELDDFGGHCGRADDYHYHIAPTHLQQYVGKTAPIAYALDGFPVYGMFDPAAKPDGPNADKCCALGSTEILDELNGHYAPAPAGAASNTRGLYHYHASARYPYLNGGMRGVVTVKGDQIDPQPRANSPREALTPLRGAQITGFKAIGEATEPAWSLEYTLAGKKHYVNYRLKNGKWTFDFVDSTGATNTESYDASSPQRNQGAGSGRGARRGPREDGNRPPPEPDHPSQTNQQGNTRAPADSPTSGKSFTLTSADVANGRLCVDCTCDGKSRTPALAWSNPPNGTNAFAVTMHHIARDGDTHVYMVVANISASARELNGAATQSGTWGRNTVNRLNQYAPPCSQGPGDKAYIITLYALSAEVALSKGAPLTRDALVAAIKDTTLATTTLDLKYARPSGTVTKDGG